MASRKNRIVSFFSESKSEWREIWGFVLYKIVHNKTHLAVGSPGQCTFCSSRCPWCPYSSRFSDGSPYPGPLVSGTCHWCHWPLWSDWYQQLDPVCVTWNCVSSTSLSRVTSMCHWSINRVLSTTLSTQSLNSLQVSKTHLLLSYLMQATKNCCSGAGAGCRIQTKLVQSFREMKRR